MTHLLVMGILNATPDSFSDGGELNDLAARDARIETMLAAGVDLIDIGGESTRPGHTPVPADEETRRVIPVIDAVRERDKHIPISIDTRKAAVARAALAAGASLVNDVSTLSDPGMGDVVGEFACAYIGMRSADCVDPIVDSCRRQLEDLMVRAEAAGIPASGIVLDPGLGFGARPGPSVEDNLALVDSVSHYALGRPVSIGASRKRFVLALVGNDSQRRVEGSVAVAVRAARAGASIVRVHDVEETVAGLDEAGLRPSDRA
jgi:dihydropteroate synthase